MPPTYSLVVPIFNEEAVIPVLMRRLDALLETLDAEAEVILVDDGSKDTSAIVIEAKARADQRYRLVKLSRNFGHQIAITVGLNHAAGRAVIVMDADLQDPPEVALAMIAKWKEGYDVVSAERASRQGESRFKRATADLFYRLMGWLGDVSTHVTPAISAWSIARRSTAFSPCPSATASCAACSPGSGSVRER
jgi:glycosyltransferase involved in cell wall biosynthesis